LILTPAAEYLNFRRHQPLGVSQSSVSARNEVLEKERVFR
jgi:hypothetical protein